MQLLGPDGQPVKACLQFMYRGYQISCSTIFMPHEVAIFKGITGDRVHKCNYPQDAIDWVNQQIEAKHRAQPLPPARG